MTPFLIVLLTLVAVAAGFAAILALFHLRDLLRAHYAESNGFTALDLLRLPGWLLLELACLVILVVLLLTAAWAVLDAAKAARNWWHAPTRR